MKLWTFEVLRIPIHSLSHIIQEDAEYIGSEVILVKSNPEYTPLDDHLFCFTPHIRLRQKRSTAHRPSVSTAEVKQAEQTILRPAIKVNPLGHVILTSGALFSQTRVLPDPVRIQYYRFRIVDITIGLLERRNAPGDGAETWSKVHEFTGHEVLSRKIRYVANVLQPENFQPSLKDTIILKVIHLTNTKEQVILVLPVNFVRIELTLSRNEPLTILQTHQISAVAVPRGNCITRWNLEVESVPPQPPHNMYYTVTKATKHGHIYLLKGNNDKVYLGLGSVFRQSDVNAGQLFYKFKRVINNRSEATLRIEKGLIYVKDEFHFRIHIHSYRPKKEHVFGIDILESRGESKTPPSMLNLPLNFRKQVGFINKCGILTIKPPLLEIGKRDCLKIQTLQLKSPPMFEYIVEILSQPQSGKVYIVQPDRKCAIDTTFLPVSLLMKGMLIYAHDGSHHPNDEFKFRVICQDTRGLFESVTDQQVPLNLLTLKQVIKGAPPIGSPFTETFHIRIQADKCIPPQISLHTQDGRLVVKAPGDFISPQSPLYLACPQSQSNGDCSGGYFIEQGKGTFLAAIVISSTSRQVFHVVPQTSDRFCLHCYVSDGVSSFYKEIPTTFSNLVVDLQKEVTITSVINGTTYIFFKMAYNVDVSPEDVSIRVVRAPVSGCLLFDDHAVDEFNYSAILRYRITYWQCKSLHDRMFSILNLTELRDATLLNSTLTVENFDALTLGMIITPPQGITWGGRVDVKVRLTMNDLTALKNIKLHSSMTLPLIQVKANLLSVQLVNPSPRKFIQVRISRSPIQLRDILPLEAMEKADAVYRVFSCKNETHGDLTLLEQTTDSRGSTHEQPLTIRISVSPGRYAISVGFVFNKSTKTA
ncbi:Chondroitin sulfate proteoglycan 4 [Taenia solium]|eukprot:TsM_001114600 transcript=TsM_001114600 gene=TsM_001114600